MNNSAIYSSIYVGTSRFKEISNTEKIIKNREETFKGSFLEFFRNFAKMDWGKRQVLVVL